MKYVKLFEEFLNEAKEQQDLFKAYLCIDPGSGHRWWSYKDFAGSKFFVQLTLENYKDIDIDPELPVLNYNSKVCKTLLDEGLIKDDNVYNHPKYIKQSGSKSEFHKIVDGDENIPQTCHNKEDALEIGFPLIAKPADGHSGLGIQVFKDKKSFDSADHSKLDVYSEYIDKKSEHRLFNFKGTPFFWMEREPLNDKAKSGDGDGEEEMQFKYIKRDVSTIPQKFHDLVEKFCKKFSDLPYLCFDIMEDQDGKLYIIESNSQPGVPYDSTIETYKQIFNDFFKRDLDKQTLTELEKLAKFMNAKTLELDPKRFEIK
tara:strand:+ start:11642 stop:12586 length:945 start_codon:yes stop_codon:yes gene_type:complete